MDVDFFSLFFAILALACVATVPSPRGQDRVAVRWTLEALYSFREDVGRVAVPLAWVVATVTTLGSLYFSEIADFVPCKLCWYQRICMYPLVVILGVAAPAVTAPFVSTCCLWPPSAPS
jgi:hypothetical protein